MVKLNQHAYGHECMEDGEMDKLKKLLGQQLKWNIVSL